MPNRLPQVLPKRIEIALYRLDFKALKRFVNKQTVNLQDTDDGRTLLMLAVGLEDALGLIRFLIDRGADVNLADHTGGHTALHFAAINLDKEAIRILLAAGADPNAQDASGWTPLHHVVRRPDLRKLMVLDLVRSGANPNMRDGAGVSPKDEVKRTGERDLLRCLLQARRKRKPTSK